MTALRSLLELGRHGANAHIDPIGITKWLGSERSKNTFSTTSHTVTGHLTHHTSYMGNGLERSGNVTHEQAPTDELRAYLRVQIVGFWVKNIHS